MTKHAQQTQPNALIPFFILWIGQAISLFGSQIVQFALIWWLTQETGSATVLALATLMGMLPQILLGPFAGVLVDRWSRRWTMFTADLAIVAATIVLAVLFASGDVQIWQVYALLLVRGMGAAFHFPAMQASTTLMVPEKHLTRIQGLNQMIHGGLNIVSAPLGALLLSVLTMPQILSIDVITALAAVIPLLFIAVPQPKKVVLTDSAEAPVASYWNELRSGLRYVRSWRGLMLLIGMAMIINLVLTPSSSLIPLLITNHFNGGAWELGMLEAMFGLGVVIGGVLLGVWGGFKRRMYTSLLGLYLIGAANLVIGLTPGSMLGLAIASMLVLGSAVSFANGPLTAIFQSTVAPDMQGRVFTLLGSLTGLMTPIGLLLAGPIADSIGISTWYIIGGGVTLAVAVTGHMTPAVVNIEEEKRPAEGVVFEDAPEEAVVPDQLLI